MKQLEIRKLFSMEIHIVLPIITGFLILKGNIILRYVMDPVFRIQIRIDAE